MFRLSSMLTSGCVCFGVLAVSSNFASAQTPPTASPTSVLFEDDFDDAAVASTAAVADAWNVRNREGGSIESVDGHLKIIAGGADWANFHLMTPVRPAFDIFSYPLTIALEGIKITANDLPAELATLRLTLSPDAKPEYASPTGISVSVNGANRVRLGYKVDVANKDPDSANNLVYKDLPGAVSGLRVTFSAEAYDLRVSHLDASGNPTMTPFTGRWASKGPGLTKEAWGGSGGGSLILLGQRAKVDNAAATATFEIDAVRVSSGDGAK